MLHSQAHTEILEQIADLCFQLANKMRGHEYTNNSFIIARIDSHHLKFIIDSVEELFRS